MTLSDLIFLLSQYKASHWNIITDLMWCLIEPFSNAWNCWYLLHGYLVTFDRASLNIFLSLQSNTLSTEQNGRYFAADSFKRFVDEYI